MSTELVPSIEKISTLQPKQWAGSLHSVSQFVFVYHIDSYFICILVAELIQELDPNHDGKITHEEFILILKYIEQK